MRLREQYDILTYRASPHPWNAFGTILPRALVRSAFSYGGNTYLELDEHVLHPGSPATLQKGKRKGRFLGIERWEWETRQFRIGRDEDKWVQKPIDSGLPKIFRNKVLLPPIENHWGLIPVFCRLEDYIEAMGGYPRLGFDSSGFVVKMHFEEKVAAHLLGKPNYWFMEEDDSV